MDAVNALFATLIGMLLAVMLAIVAVAIEGHLNYKEYREAFIAECTAKGGVPQFNQRSTDLCLPTGSVIPMKDAR